MVEAGLGDDFSASEEPSEDAVSFDGETFLYVGGKSGHASALREIGRRFSADLLYHDGGVEDHISQLPGLMSQARAVFFPVDCTSHDSVYTIKRLSRLSGKTYVPLRSAGLTSFLAALKTLAKSGSEQGLAAIS